VTGVTGVTGATGPAGTAPSGSAGQVIYLVSTGVAAAASSLVWNSTDSRLDVSKVTAQFSEVDNSLYVGGGTNTSAATRPINTYSASYPNFLATGGSHFYFNDVSSSTLTGQNVTNFGNSCAMSADGNTILIVGQTAGGSTAYIYRYSGGSWSATAMNAKVTVGFGVAADMSADGNRAIVTGNNSTPFVYTCTNGTWDLAGTALTLPGSVPAQFGQSCAMSSDGNTVLVTGYGATAVPQIYRYSGSSWSNPDALTMPGAAPTNFGQSCAMSSDGNTLLITGLGSSTAPQIYRYTNGSWVITALTGVATTNFGQSCAMSADGNTIVITAYTTNTAPYLYRYSGSAWPTATTLAAYNVTNMGLSCAISADGNTLLVTALGTVQPQLYRYYGGSWTVIGLSAQGFASSGQACALSADGNMVLVTAKIANSTPSMYVIGPRFRVNNTLNVFGGAVGIGNITPANINSSIPLNIQTGTNQYDAGLQVRESTYSGSTRASIIIGTDNTSWTMGQDSSGNGTRDFFLYGGTGGNPATMKFSISPNGNFRIIGTNNSARIILGPSPSSTNLDYCSVIESQSATNDNYSSYLRFLTHDGVSNTGEPVQAMAINSVQNVGIGTNNPLSRLHIFKNGINGNLGGEIRVCAGAEGVARIGFYEGEAGDRWGAWFQYNGYQLGNGADLIQIGAKRDTVDYTYVNIDATNGNVGLGNIPNATYKLNVSGTIGASGDITALYSDERLKTKTGDLSEALTKVCSLDTFTYVNNDLAKSLGFTDELQRVGVSAQQVQKVLPEAVRPAPFDADNKSGQNYLTVQYEKLVPLLIEALKEERQKREAIEERLTRLEKLLLKE
jgi:hypothetical protein